MDAIRVRGQLSYLVRKYVSEESLMRRLLDEIEDVTLPNVPVRGILHEVSTASRGKIDGADGDIIKDLVFNFG